MLDARGSEYRLLSSSNLPSRDLPLSFVSCSQNTRHSRAFRQGLIGSESGTVVHYSTQRIMEQTGESLHRSLDLAIRSGGLESWEQFIREAHGLISATVFSSLSRWQPPQRDRVEDLVQETFLKMCADNFHLLRCFRSNRPEALVAYLRAIAATVVSDAQRARSAQKRGAANETVDLDQANLAVTDRNDSVERVERALLFRRVAECLSAQKERDRQIFWLYYRHGLSSQAIAAIEIMELTSSGVESLIRRLTIAVRKCLKISPVRKMSRAAKGNMS